jgi:hypothetical protein
MLIVLVMLMRRTEVSPTVGALFSSIDLPLFFIAMIYGGSSLYMSLARGRTSIPLLLGIFLPIGLLFLVLCWFNFGMPFPEF